MLESIKKFIIKYKVFFIVFTISFLLRGGWNNVIIPYGSLALQNISKNYYAQELLKEINKDTPKEISDEVLLEGATFENVTLDENTDDEYVVPLMEINWKLYNLTESELDLDSAKEILNNDILETFEAIDTTLLKKHNMTLAYNIRDKNDEFLFSLWYGKEDF